MTWTQHRFANIGLCGVLLVVGGGPIWLIAGAAPHGGPAAASPAQAAADEPSPRAELDRISRYLPDDLQMLVTVRLDALLASPTAQKIEARLPGLRQRVEKQWRVLERRSDLKPSDVATLYLGLTFAKDPYRIVVAKRPIAKEAFVSHLEDDEYRAVEIGAHTLYETQSHRSRRGSPDKDIRDTRPTFDGSGDGYCLVAPNILVLAQAKELQSILERKRDFTFSGGLQAALKSVDLAQPITVVGSFRESHGIAGPWDREPMMKSIVESSEHFAGHITLQGDVSAKATLVCTSADAAEQLRKLAEGGMAMLKFDKKAPQEAIEIIDAIRLSRTDAKLTGECTIGAPLIASLFERTQKEADEPAYFGRRLSRMLADFESKNPATRKSAAGDIGRMGAEAQSAAPALGRLLEDSDKDVRIQAALALGRMGVSAKSALPALIDATRDANSEVRRCAVESVGRLGAGKQAGATTALVRALKDNDSAVRSAAITSLGRLGPDAREAVPALVEVLQANDATVSRWAATALGDIGADAKQAGPALLEAALHDANAEMNRAAAAALPRVDPTAVPQLIEALTDADAAVRARAAAALGEYGAQAKPAANSLGKAVSDSNADVQTAAAWALGRIGPAAREALPQLAEAAERDVRGAVFALQQFGPAAKPAVPALLARLDRGAPIDQGSVIEALGAIGPDAKDAAGALRSRIRDEYNGVKAAWALWKIEGNADETVAALADLAANLESYKSEKEAAIRALGEMGPAAHKAVPVLIAAVETQAPLSSGLKEAAIEALGKIGPEAKAAVPVLRKALRSKESFGRGAAKAAEALGRIGPDARAAIPSLIRALERGDYEMMKTVPLALAQMGPEAKKATAILEERVDRYSVSRMQAAAALWKLDGQIDRPLRVAIATLSTSESFPEERLLAVTVLREMGPRAVPAAPTLLTLRGERDAALRQAVDDVLRKLESAADVKTQRR